MVTQRAPQHHSVHVASASRTSCGSAPAVRGPTVLAFLRHLPDRREQAAVLRRRQDFLETPASFFHRDGQAVRAEETGDLFRQGMLRVARATGAAEREWLTEAIAQLGQAS